MRAVACAVLLGTSFACTPLGQDEAAIRFAVIGDYGLAGDAERDVAALVKSWQPQLVITTGDNNYYLGEASTIDHNIGQYYHEFIAPYRGVFGAGADVNRFFPALGNHDLNAPGAQPYLDYFTLPGNERYYDFTRGPLHFFVLDSDPREPDGVGQDSLQALWLQRALAASRARWQLVYFHHAPYSSEASSTWMRWPFGKWGVDLVIAGHSHTYERLSIDGVSYLVVGISGCDLRAFHEPELPGSAVRYNADFGALRVTASRAVLTFELVTRAGIVIDRGQIEPR